MEIIINMICIWIFIACFEISGFMSTTEMIINEKRKMHGKKGVFRWGYPLGCNVCQCFWCEIIWVLISGPVNLITVTACILLAVSQPVIISLIRLILDTLETIFIKINTFINS